MTVDAYRLCDISQKQWYHGSWRAEHNAKMTLVAPKMRSGWKVAEGRSKLGGLDNENSWHLPCQAFHY